MIIEWQAERRRTRRKIKFSQKVWLWRQSVWLVSADRKSENCSMYVLIEHTTCILSFFSLPFGLHIVYIFQTRHIPNVENINFFYQSRKTRRKDIFGIVHVIFKFNSRLIKRHRICTEAASGMKNEILYIKKKKNHNHVCGYRNGSTRELLQF